MSLHSYARYYATYTLGMYAQGNTVFKEILLLIDHHSYYTSHWKMPVQCSSVVAFPLHALQSALFKADTDFSLLFGSLGKLNSVRKGHLLFSDSSSRF